MKGDLWTSVNRFLEFLGYRDRIYQGNDFNVRIEPIQREDLSVVHIAGNISTNMLAIWIGNNRMAISLPKQLGELTLERLVKDLQTALNDMKYSFQLLLSGKVLFDSEVKSNPSTFTFLSPWHPLDATRAAQLCDELKRELPSGHPLFDMTFVAAAARSDRDDVLFEVAGGEKPLAVIHLSWQKETEADWPSLQFFDSWEDWVSRSMSPAHKGFLPE